MCPCIIRSLFLILLDFFHVFSTKLFSLPVPPMIIGNKDEEVSVIKGHMVSLLCDVQAYPPPEITWTKDGHILQFSTGIHLLPGHPSAQRYPK